MFPTLRHVIRPVISGGFFISLVLSTAVCAEGTSPAVPVAESVQAQSFEQWLTEFKSEARTKGISDKTLEESFRGVQPIPQIIEYDRRQPEFTRTFWSYLDRAVDPTRIKKAQELEQKHRVLLDQISQKYGVQKRFLLAFWGLESNFGEHTGGFSVIAANATLAYDTRRSEFFRTQLLEALKIVQAGHISADRMTGSWAGAMGHLQFIPSTYTRYAVDENGDGRQDIWQSLPDVFGSAANYLGQIGWTDKYTWGREVQLPSDFNWDLAGLETNLPLAEWQIQGVRSIDGTNLPDAMIEASLILPAGHKGPAFLVYSNYRKILNWNRSILYAIAVGHLSDRIAGAGPLQTVRQQDERALHRSEVEEIQSLLAKLGFDVGEPDGIVGQKTREGIRAYQKKVGLPGDGYPDEELLNKLRAS
ncbi:lytic murein transglycosylase [Kiloniella laminariae]|uniref:Lytic murein transglycosylase n=1 Tax=Kiloniella laminariae TaxID=454162 RepID=A0ABT4LLB9_9PROT|nr:lytic murein transglycosylase [Kiloniella laminariae]MCZ4281899.1 lytic murein transglycosylase [Kiloniella laminariae]